MSGELVHGKGIDGSGITRENYSESLLKAAVSSSVIGEDSVGEVSRKLILTLQDVLGYYTKNESSSLRTDRLAKLARSMTYDIDTYLLTLGSHEEALKKLLGGNFSEMYGKGYLINAGYFKEAKVLYGRARYTRIEAGPAYDRMMDRQFLNYLEQYDPRFSADMKIYLSQPRLGITGAFHIDETLDVLKKIIAFNTGGEPDFVADASETEDGTMEKRRMTAEHEK